MTKHKKNTAGDDDDAFDIVVSTSDPLDLDSKKEEETEEKQLQKEAAQSKVASRKRSDKTASSKKTTPVKKVDTPESSDEDTENEEIDDQENKEITNLDKSDPPTKTANIEVVKTIIDSVKDEQWYKLNTTINLPPEIRDNLEVLVKKFNLPVKGVVSGIIMHFIDQHFDEYHKIKKEQEKKSLKWRG